MVQICLNIELKNESYNKVISYSSTNEGPDYFKVWSKDGKIIEYGNTLSSRIELQKTENVGYVWLLNKVSDRFGNTIEYDYYEDHENGYYKILGIRYGGVCEIKFHYKSREDILYKYLAPGKVNQQRELIDRIEIYVNSSLQYYYLLDYAYRLQTSYVSNVQLIHSSGAKLNPVKFEYGTEDPYIYEPLDALEGIDYSYPWDGQMFYFDTTRSFMADFNSDGLQDFFVVYNWSYGGKVDGYRVYYGNHGEHGNYYTFSTISGSINEYSEYIKAILPGDLDGDGKIDFILVKNHPSKTEFIPFRFTGTSFEIKPSFYSYEKDERLEYYLADFNGDSKSELVTIIDVPLSHKVIYKTYAFIMNPDLQFISLPEYEDWDTHVYEDNFYITDMTADGRPDLVRVDVDGSYIYEFVFEPDNTIADPINVSFPTAQFKFFWGDFNADGYTDVLKKDDGNILSAYIFDGETSWNLNCNFNAIYQDIKYADEKTTFSLLDYNGDGFSDICMTYPHKIPNSPNGTWTHGFLKKIFIGNGHTFTEWDNLYIIHPNQNLEMDVSNLIGDFNSNSTNDFMFSTIHFNGTNEKMLFALTPLSNLGNVLSSIKDEYGNKSTISYQNLISGSNYLNYSDAIYPIRDFVGPLPVVTNICTYDGIGLQNENIREICYSYEGAKLHVKGKGFLGFSKIKVTDKDAKTWIINQNKLLETENYVMLAPWKIYTYYNNNVNDILLSEREFFFEVYNGTPNTPWGKRHSLNLIKTQLKEWSLSGEFIKTQRIIKEYDEFGYIYGNIHKTIEYLSENEINFQSSDLDFKIGKEIRTEYEYSGVSNWIINRPTELYTRSFAENESDISESIFFEEYYNEGDYRYPLLKKQIVNKNTNLELVTVYNYNSKGQLVTETSSTPKFEEVLPDRLITNEYDENHEYRFLTKKTNSLGYTVVNVIDENKGVIKQVIDENQLITDYSYDVFGNLTNSKNTNNIETVTANRWIDQNHTDFKKNALWYSWNCSSGSEPEMSIYDAFGRIIRVVYYNKDGNKLYVEKEYDHFGRPVLESHPHSPNNTNYYKTTMTYDVFNRPLTITSPGEPGDGDKIISYSYGACWQEQTDVDNKKSKKTYNVKGQVIRSSHRDQEYVEYIYYSNGLLKNTAISGNSNTAIVNEYDLNGNMAKEIKPNIGTTIYKYNPYGELVYSEDKNGLNKYAYKYDPLGRVLESQNLDPNYITDKKTWTYFNTFPKKGLLDNIKKGDPIAPYHQISYLYDNKNRVKDEIETINGEQFQTHYTYDKFGRIETMTYPNGLLLLYHYVNGNLKRITSQQGSIEVLVWEGKEYNEMGSLTLSKLGKKVLETTYAAGTNSINTIKCSGIQDFEYQYDNLGNLQHRYDNYHTINNNSLHEEFTYDATNQLIKVVRNGNQVHNYSYDGFSNIINKENTGVLNYPFPDKPYRLHNVIPSDNLPDSYIVPETIEYNGNNKVNKIIANGLMVEIQYGANNQRISQSLTDINNQNNLIKEKKYISNLVEVTSFSNGTSKTINYVYSPEGLVALQIETIVGSQSNKEWYLVFTDNLGSITTLFNEGNQVKYEMSYDCWGTRRDPQTWQEYTTPPVNSVIDRGYTGHEHIDVFGLINMNGRVYDPTIGRFLSPDPLIQFPDIPQNYNTYSYCMNNPLRYTDPSGYSIGGSIGSIIGMLAWQVGYNINANNGAFDLSNCTFIIGINTTTNFSNANCYVGVSWSTGASIYVGYNGNFGYGSDPQDLYFPNYNYGAPEENAVNSINGIPRQTNIISNNIFAEEQILADIVTEGISPTVEYTFTIYMEFRQNALRFNARLGDMYTKRLRNRQINQLIKDIYDDLEIYANIPVDQEIGLDAFGYLIVWRESKNPDKKFEYGDRANGVYIPKSGIESGGQIIMSKNTINKPYLYFTGTYTHEFIHYFQDVCGIPFENWEYEAHTFNVKYYEVNGYISTNKYDKPLYYISRPERYHWAIKQLMHL